MKKLVKTCQITEYIHYEYHTIWLSALHILVSFCATFPGWGGGSCEPNQVSYLGFVMIQEQIHIPRKIGSVEVSLKELELQSSCSMYSQCFEVRSGLKSHTDKFFQIIHVFLPTSFFTAQHEWNKKVSGNILYLWAYFHPPWSYLQCHLNHYVQHFVPWILLPHTGNTIHDGLTNWDEHNGFAGAV